MNISKSLSKLTSFEKKLWGISVALIIVSYLLSGTQSMLSLFTSVIGATALIFLAKGDVLGEFICIIFSVLYGIISFQYRYYGEMITYLCMTGPIAVLSVISWLKNPYLGNKAEVKVNTISKPETVLMWGLTAVITVLFSLILAYFNTAYIVPSTLSVTTSFLAVYLTFRRSPYFALAYASNDIVLIVLWVLASLSDAKYISVVVCFVAFLANDIYGYLSWQTMKKRQMTGN